MHLVTKGLVIRAVDYKDADRILTVLSSERGKITVGARGARRKNSRLLAGSQLFAYSEMTLFDRGGRLYLDSADVLDQFRGLSRDIETMALASYFAEILNVEAEENTPHPDVLRLTLNALHALSSGGFDTRAVKPAFELKYVALSGWLPDLGVCAACSAATDSGYFEIDSGQLRCKNCRPQSAFVPVDAQTLAAARYIISANVNRVFSFKINAESLDALGEMTEQYAQTCLERDFRALRFYKSLQTDELKL